MGRHRESGQGLIEYSLIILLVAIAMVATLTTFGGAVSGALTSIIGSL